MDKIKQSFSYDNGNLIWIGKPSKRKKGQILGTLGNHGYLVTYFDGKLELVHRIIFALHYGYFPKKPNLVDHKDGNRLNNKIENLRESTYSQNLCNKVTYNNTSSFKGVYWNELNKNWRVRISVNKKAYNIGSFGDFEEAKIACIDARKKLHGEYAKH
jgi:hypothetical protein